MILHFCPLISSLLYLPTGPLIEKVIWTILSGHRSMKVIAIESHRDLIPRLSAEALFQHERPLFTLLYPRHDQQIDLFDLCRKSNTKEI